MFCVGKNIYGACSKNFVSKEESDRQSPWSFVTKEGSDKQIPLPSPCSVSEEDSDRKSPPKFVTEQVSDVALEFGH